MWVYYSRWLNVAVVRIAIVLRYRERYNSEFPQSQTSLEHLGCIFGERGVPFWSLCLEPNELYKTPVASKFSRIDGTCIIIVSISMMWNATLVFLHPIVML